MISPLLEQLVLTNQATIKVHNHAVGGVGTINVPAGKKIIITQIIWNPFIDIVNSALQGDKIFDFPGSFLHTLKLRNKQNRYAYSFRDSFMPYVFNEPGVGLRNLISPAKPTIINTYLPFTEGNVEIDIMKFNNFNQWVVSPTYVPANVIEPDPGEGYGNAASINKFFSNGNTLFFGFVPPPFQPTGFDPLGTRGTGAVPGISYEFEGNLPLTLIPNNPNNTDFCMFPMVTFTYVEINTRYIPGQVGQVDLKK